MAVYDLHLNKSRIITVVPTIDGVPTTNAESCVFSTTRPDILELGHDPENPTDSFKTAVKLLTLDAADVSYVFDGHKGEGLVEVTGSFSINPLQEDANGSTTEGGPEF